MGKEPARAFRLVEDLTPCETPAPASDDGKRSKNGREAAPSRCRSAVPDVPAVPSSKEIPPREEDPVSAAVNRAISLLTYGDMSRRKLLRKLTDRGIAPDVAEQAARVLEDRGYLREDEACYRRAEQGARKGWGQRRIADDLYAQAYPRDLIACTMERLTDTVDFAEQCADVIRKKYHGVPPERDDRRRLIAALARRGYGMEDIRAAMSAVMADECEDDDR